MKPYMIFGVDTVAGAELARSLCPSQRVIGVGEGHLPEIEQCEMISGQAASQNPGKLIKDFNISCVIDASTCGDSIWNPDAQIGSEEQCATSLKLAAACRENGIPYILLSSDGVVSSPWMFHEEDSESVCSSVVAQRLLDLERQVLAGSSDTLVIRTHPIGWSATDGQPNWLESLLERMMTNRPCPELLLPGHATPIAATELANIVCRALAENLRGLYHIAGAERVHRIEFARKLAQQFEIGWLGPDRVRIHYTESERSRFGCGECSLQTRTIRKALCVAMPTLTESFSLLQEQLAERIEQPVHHQRSRAA